MMLSLLLYALKFGGRISTHYTFITLSVQGVYFEPPGITVNLFCIILY